MNRRPPLVPKCVQKIVIAAAEEMPLNIRRGSDDLRKKRTTFVSLHAPHDGHTMAKRIRSSNAVAGDSRLDDSTFEWRDDGAVGVLQKSRREDDAASARQKLSRQCQALLVDLQLVRIPREQRVILDDQQQRDLLFGSSQRLIERPFENYDCRTERAV
jgi:hypothetical protein